MLVRGENYTVKLWNLNNVNLLTLKLLVHSFYLIVSNILLIGITEAKQIKN